jgi:hypothetical protein
MVERQPGSAPAANPLRQVPLLDDISAATSPPAAATRGAARRRLRAALLAREEGDRRLGGHRLEQRHEVRRDLLLLPALDAVDDDEAPADRERQGAEHGRRGGGRRVSALEQLEAARAAVGFGERTQPRPPLADPPVVVAVDQVRGFEARHDHEASARSGGRRAGTRASAGGLAWQRSTAGSLASASRRRLALPCAIIHAAVGRR